MTDNTYIQAKDEAEQTLHNLIAKQIDELRIKFDQVFCIITQLNKRLDAQQKRMDFLEDKQHNHSMEIDAHKEPIRKEKIKKSDDNICNLNY